MSEPANAFTHLRINAFTVFMPDKKIKAVLFDLGETLLNFGKVNATSLFRQGARLSYDFLKSLGQPAGSFECYFWRNLVRVRIWHLFSGIMRRDFDAFELLRRVGTKKRIRLSPPQWQRLAWLWYEPLSKLARTESGTKETLTCLKKSGLKLGIVSNTFISSYSLENHLSQLGLLDLFAVRVYSHEFDFRKPDLRIFRAAAERIGEAMEDIMYVGDSIYRDIRPAVKAGMYAVAKDAYTNAGKKLPEGALRIHQLSELPGLIERINTEAM
jgi:HAD superfamily hydrolase (TIGR01549 family)